MRKLTPVYVRPWTLPLIVLGLIAPPILGALLLGAVGALAAGALTVATVIVIAARTTFEEEIEVAPTEDRGHRTLVVLLASLEETATADAVLDEIGNGERAFGGPSEALVVAPALNAPVSHWLSDLRAAREEAERRLVVSLGRLAAADVDARGEVGDTDPVQAVEDALRTFPAHEVIFVAPEGTGGEQVADLRRRLDRPVLQIQTTTPVG